MAAGRGTKGQVRICGELADRVPLVIGVYAALVLLATQVFRFHSTVAVAAATLAAAALFNPLRRRAAGGGPAVQPGEV